MRAGPGRKVFRIRKRKSLRDMLAIIVILSGAKNLFPCEPKAADGLCARGVRRSAALNMTVAAALRKEVNDKRVQSNICIVSIQILRRYAPQNDELLLNCEF
jgi:hypothetical protein